MKKVYRNATPSKPKPPTKAQLRRQWEHTVIAGGMVRASAFPRTAMMLNKGRGAVVRVIAVPLYADRHLQYLEQIADFGIMGQTPEEVAAIMIMDAIIKGIADGTIDKIAESMRLVREINATVDYKPESLRNSTCTGKTRHETFADAVKQQKAGPRTPHKGIKRDKIAPYRCQFCNGFHVGHGKGKNK